ncbi:MAG: T9SS type A sorting domain-containing protein [Bacteroidetes bacterium]|nr:T9SS type A sorting domain-containing protein [Bacteroidota bacterium]
MKTSYILLLTSYFLLLTSYMAFGQHYTRTDTIPVYQNGDTLQFPWAGGHNYCQFSDIDINLDGIKDLFVFDRTGNKVSCYINKGTPGMVDYYDSTQKYASHFPHLEQWALCIDYNCDGKKDIFTSSIWPSGIRVYKNVSTGNNLQFVQEKIYLKDMAGNTIPANPAGIPAIDDVDGDGDIDIITYASGSWTASYYENKSMQSFGNCDSLVFALSPNCWGHFSETGVGQCTVTLLSCKTMNPDSLPPANDSSPPEISSAEKTNSDNGSSCMFCLDMDADGDKELLLGQNSCCSMTLLTNGGTPTSANITSFTNTFPPVDYINVRYNPCGFYVDVNNDNIRDLLVAPGTQNVGVNNESIWYYKNMGADNAPVFQRQTRSFLQENMIDVGSGSDAVFFDYDNDGKTDLLVSNYVMSYDTCTPSGTYSYGVRAYRNIGTLSSPKFILADTNFANLSTVLPNMTDKHLTFGDVDGDGDADMFAGDYNGNIHYFQNTGGNFSLVLPVNYKDAGGTDIDIGSYSTPFLIDADRDGDLDLLIGEQAGNINYYENTGTPAVPSYSLITTSLGGVDVLKWNVTGYSVPFMYDDGGKYKLLVGSEGDKANGHATGWIWLFDSIENHLGVGGKFHLIDSLYQNIWEGINMTVFGKDINNDGRMDLVIGNKCGGAAIYLGDTLTTGISEAASEDFDFTVYPNPTSGQFQIQVGNGQPAMGNEYKIEIYNVLGEKMTRSVIPSAARNLTIDLSNQPSGIYFCKVTNGKNPDSYRDSKTKKIVLLK